MLSEMGMERAHVARAMAFEGGLVSLIGVLGGMTLSLALGWLLIFVINRQSFGWTLFFRIPWGELLLSGLAVIGCGGLVTWRVGRWAARLRADREE